MSTGGVRLPESPPRIEHVLVPFDGSELARSALATARVLAARLHAELRTISVTVRPEEVAEFRRSAAEALEVDEGDPRAMVVNGFEPATEIARHAARLEGCLVCMSTRGRGRIAGALIGSVATSVFQRSPDPVIAVGPSADRHDWSRSPRGPAPLSVSRIVACVDGSPESERALPVAAAWAKMLEMSLTIVTITDESPPSLRTDDERRGPYGSAGGAEPYVAGLVGEFQASDIEVTGTVIRDPLGVASGLRAYLDEQPAGLVALTTHARSGMQRLRLGSAAADMIQVSTAPCLVVPLHPEPSAD